MECSCDIATIVPGPIEQRFTDLRSHVASNTLDQWATYGVQEWVYGKTNQDCNEVCAGKYLLCDSSLNDEVIFAMQTEEMKTIVPLLSYPPFSCGSMAKSTSQYAPYSMFSTCFFPDTSNYAHTCEGKSSIGKRLCACTNPTIAICPALCTAGSYGLNGIGPCTPCPAGSTSTAGASSTAECKCNSTTYNSPVPVLLAGYENVFERKILDLWKTNNVQEWVLGANGADCDDTCETKNMVCDGALDKNVFLVLQGDEMKELMPMISNQSINCANLNTKAEYIYTPSASATGNRCYHSSTILSDVKFTCAGTQVDRLRACPCSAKPVDHCKICPVPEENGGSVPPGCEIITPLLTGVAGSCQKDTNGFCKSCLPGTFSTRDTTVDHCTPCPAGTWNSNYNGNSVASCTLCRPGKFSTVPGMISAESCQHCPEGTFHRRFGATDDLNCQTCSCR